MAVYSELKIPEVWCWKEGELTIYLLREDEDYIESETSLAFGTFSVKDLTNFVQVDLQKGENERMKQL
ncbi:MAG: hypothetical protein ACRC8A_00160 [Microcoleaceae cyanobacterium]